MDNYSYFTSGRYFVDHTNWWRRYTYLPISMLNSYSGWAAAGIGFTLENTALIITGALVGSSGAILSYIMCKGMNRSFFNVILEDETVTKHLHPQQEKKPVKNGNADDAAFVKNASSVIIVPGYGMAVAQAPRFENG